MTMHDSGVNNLELFYTLDPKSSVGWRHDYWRGPQAHMDAVQYNRLLKRWNAPASQANLYLRGGTGVAYDGDGRVAPALYGGMAADWEDRRFYISYGNEFITAGDIYDKAAHTARIGVAPYIGNYGDLHTWLMLQADYDHANGEDLTFTPLVRLFKGDTLMEFGVNLDRGAFFSLMRTF